MSVETVFAAIKIANSTFQLFSPKGYSISNLLQIQTDMLLNISKQVVEIHKGVEKILKDINEVKKILGDLPTVITEKEFQVEISAILNLYKEHIESFFITRDAHGIKAAQDEFRDKFENDILRPLRLKRHELFHYNNPINIPYICASLNIEVQAMIICDYHTDKIKKIQFMTAIEKYKNWLSEQDYIPKKIEEHRFIREKIRTDISKIKKYKVCKISDQKTPGSATEIKDPYRLKCDEHTYGERNALNDDDANKIRNLLDDGYLEEDDLPKKLYFLNDKISNSFEINFFVAFNPDSGGPQFSIKYSTHNHIIPSGEKGLDIVESLPKCGSSEPRWFGQPNNVDILSDKLENSGYPIITLASFSATRSYALNSIERFKDEISKTENSDLNTFFSDSQNPEFVDSLIESDPSLKLGEEVDAASKIINLANMPLGASIIQFAALKFRNKAIEREINNEFSRIQNKISETLINPGVGFLLEVCIYTNEFGHLYIPCGQILIPIGAGTEPLDSYSEHLRQPNLRQTIPPGLKDNTFFIWVTKHGDFLKGATIAKEFNGFIKREAMKEADRRDAMGKWMRSLPINYLESIQISKYWVDVQESRGKLIDDQETQIIINTMTRRMRELESQTNILYQKYQENIQNISRQERYMSMLAAVTNISGLLRSAMDMGELITAETDSKITGSKMTSQVDLDSAFVKVLQENGVMKIQNRNIINLFNVNIDGLENYDRQIENLYRDKGIPLPKRHIFLKPHLP
jgi:hypothetical protein